MAIARDAVSSFPFTTPAGSWSHTCASGTVLWVSVRDDANNVTGVTWDSNAMTLLEDMVMPAGVHHKLYYIDNIGNSGGPAAGTKSLTISAGGAGASAEAISYSGFTNARIGLDAHASNGTTGVSTVQQAITTLVDNCWYVVAAQDYSGIAPTSAGAWTAQVQAGSGASSNFGDSNGVVHPAATITPIANVNAGSRSGIMVAAFYVSSATGNFLLLF